MGDYSNVIDGMFNQGPKSLTTSNIGVNPDQSARAYELEQATGVPSSIINGDIDSFEQQHKAALASDIVGANPYISDYVNSHPMAAGASNDDWGQLDKVSQSLLKVTPFANIYGSDAGYSVLKAATKAFGGAFEGPPGSTYMTPPKDIEEARAHPGYGALAAGVALAGLVPETGLRLLSGATAAVEAGGVEAIKQATGKDVSEGGENLLQTISDPGLWASIGLPDPLEGLSVRLAHNAEMRKAMDDAKVESNQEGIKALNEAVKEAQSSTTKERAPELFQNFVQQHVQDARMGISGNKVLEMYGDKVPTPDDGVLGWVPDLAAQMEAAKDTGADISVPLSDYISKVDPAIHKELQDDLRVVPGGITNYEAEEAAKFNEAKDTAQTSTGVTPPPETIVPEAVPTYRNDVGLEPLFSIGDRKLQLQRMKPYPTGTELKQAYQLAQADGKNLDTLGPEETDQYFNKVFAQRASNLHDFDMLNENGQKVGSLNLSEQKGGKELYVDLVNGIGEYYHPNNFGPSLMRDLLRQIKAQFPNAETITGHRVSGARETAGSYMQPSALPKIRLDDNSPQGWAYVDGQEKFSKLLGGAWSPLGHGFDAYIKPSELWQEHENELYDAVDAELARIAPDVYHGAVSDIRNTKNAVNPRGMYFRRDPAHKYGPYILWSMNGSDPIGTIRHEAIHHLRNDGFFKPDEWATLEKASKDEGWQDKYGIGRRYGTQPEDIKTEESIAEAYRHWAQESEDRLRQPGAQLSGVDKVFQKLKQLLDGIKAAVRRITGTENFDDLFQRVNTGEVGSRTPTQTRTPGAPLALADEKKGYDNVPDSLMGFTRSGQNKGFEQERYKHVQPVEVTLPDGSKFQDSIKGLNQSHALERAKRNWPGSEIRPIDQLDPLADEGDRPISDPGQGIDGTSPFKAARDVGMTLDQHKNYMKLIEARQQSDLKASTNRVLKEQTKRQSAEWKAQSEAMRPQVVSDLNARPDISADKFFGLGELHGTKLDKTYKLDWESLTPEQRKALPEKYTVREGGVKPDEVANLFGYQTGDQMIEGLAKITAARGDMRRDRFDRQLVSNEIASRMEREHGYLEKNILEDTRDQVLSENQLQLMHQETMKLAMDSGQAPPLDLATITAGIKSKFDELPMGAAKSAQYEREMGKQNKLAELSLLSNNPAEAFRAKQVAQHNMIYLQMARAVEKQRTRLDKAARAYRRVDPPKNVEPEYVNHIQDLLQQAGYKIRRSAENIQENIERTAQNLTEFANSKLADTNGMRDIPVADIITDNKVGLVDSMTTKDFLGFKQTIDALIENGKDERRIIKDGEAFELKAINDQMIDDIKTFDLQPLKASAGKFDKALNFPGTMLAAVTNIETFLNRLGRRDPNSVWNKFIIRPVFSAAGEKFQIQKELAGEIKDLGEFGDPNKAVAPPFLAPDGRPFTNFTRRNVWGMLQHAGNASNWTAFAKGWGQDPQVLMTWLEANTRPEDWQFMQGFGKRVFGNIVKKADGVYERLNGITIDKIPLTQFANKHGTFDGWYSPLIPDLNYSGKSPLKFGNYDDTDYGHISTANGYTMKRTGATYPISMDPSRTMTRINQMIHDVAYREVILNSQKLFKASRLNDAITAHYGADYNTENFLKPWLKDLAGQESTPSAAMGVASQVAEGLRQNIIGTYIGFNPGTVMKHGPTAWGYSMRQIGPANFLRAFRDLYLRSDDLNAENNEYILKLSNELPMRERFWQDTIGGQYSRLEQSHGLAGFRQEIQRYGALAVAKSDMISAKPTFFGAYRDARENMDMTSGDARDYADQQVRLAHGSIAAPNLPSAVRTTGAMGKFYTSLYGFFGTTMQRRIEMAHDINDAYKFYKAGDFNGAMKMSGSAFTNFMTYWVLPTAIEEAVTGTTTDDHRSWGRHLVSATFLGLSSTALFVRDIVQGIESGHETGTGLLDSALGEFSHGVEAPFKHDAWSRARAGKTVADTMTAFGLTTGMLPKTIANSSRFGIDLVNGQAHPKTIGDWYRGLARGQTKARVVK